MQGISSKLHLVGGAAFAPSSTTPEDKGEPLVKPQIGEIVPQTPRRPLELRSLHSALFFNFLSMQKPNYKTSENENFPMRQKKSKTTIESKRQYMASYRQKYAEDKKRVNLTFSNAEYEALSYFAELEGRAVTTLARDYVLAGMTGTLRTPKALERELSEANRLIRNIANNVNQMARLSNRLGVVLDENGVLSELSRLHSDLESFVAERLKEAEK